MTPEQDHLLCELAERYIWWKPAEDSLRQPEIIAAQVMNLGDYEDVQRLCHAVGDDFLRSVLLNAEIGQFNDRSWHYWHYRLDMAQPGEVPKQPGRVVA